VKAIGFFLLAIARKALGLLEYNEARAFVSVVE